MLQDAFIKHGTPLTLSGNQPHALDDPDRLWLVASGSVDVFRLRNDNNERHGVRRFLLRAEAGQLLFGVDTQVLGAGFTLVAISAQATLIELEKGPLQDLMAGIAHRDEALTAIETWVETLAQSVAPEVPPKTYTSFEAGQMVDLIPTTRLSARQGVYWGRLSKGRLRLMGLEELEIEAGAIVPLTRPFWVAAAEESTVAIHTTRDLAAQDRLFDALAVLHRLVVQALASFGRRAAEAERARLTARTAQDGVWLQRSLAGLAQVLHNSQDQRPKAGATAQDPLLIACQWVGQAMDLTVQAPARQAGRQVLDPITAIAQASKIRTRRVLLRGTWWKHDNGPLLAFRQENNHPVALLQTAPTRYELRDPATQRRQAVTPDVAAQLKPTAVTFIRPLGEEPVTIRTLWQFGTRGLKRDTRLILLAGLASALLGLLTPILAQVLFDHVIPLADQVQLIEITILLVGVALVAALFELTRGIVLLRVEAQTERNLEAAVVDRLIRLPTAFFKAYRAGDLTHRVLGIMKIRRVLTNTALTAFLGGIFSMVNLVLLFFYDVTLAFLGVLLGLGAFAFIAGTGLLVLRYNRAIETYRGKLYGLVFQFMTGITKLRVSGAEKRAFAVWAEDYAQQRRLTFKAGAVQNKLEVFNAAYPILTAMLFFFVIYYPLRQGLLPGQPAATLSTGAFIAFIVAFSTFLGKTLEMGLAVLTSLEVVPKYERLKPILEAPLEVKRGSTDPGVLTGEVEVSHVHFRYDENGPLILDDVSLHIRPGEMVALVGPSGSGKSTLLRLLLGFEEPASGSIYFDGQDLAGLDIEGVRRQMGVVLQHASVIPGSIFENIIGTASNLTLEEAWQAARMTGLDGDIEQMPMGMHTVITEGGATFSGGQRQRLMIARAIVHRPRLLFFDEATSALDNRTQQVVTESLDRLQVTRVVVAHRLSTIRNADRIYVLEAGRIVEAGTFDELMAQDGAFATLARRQLAEVA